MERFQGRKEGKKGGKNYVRYRSKGSRRNEEKTEGRKERTNEFKERKNYIRYWS